MLQMSVHYRVAISLELAAPLSPPGIMICGSFGKKFSACSGGGDVCPRYYHYDKNGSVICDSQQK